MHKTFIMFINIGIRKARNTYDSLFWFRYETFYYLFDFKVFRHEERETQFLSMLTFPSKSTTCGRAANYWSGLGELRKSTSFVQAQISTNCFFFQIPKSSARRFRAWHHSRPLSHLLSGVFIVTSLIVTSAPRACEHLYSMCAPN